MIQQILLFTGFIMLLLPDLKARANLKDLISALPKSQFSFFTNEFLRRCFSAKRGVPGLGVGTCGVVACESCR